MHSNYVITYILKKTEIQISFLRPQKLKSACYEILWILIMFVGLLAEVTTL